MYRICGVCWDPIYRFKDSKNNLSCLILQSNWFKKHSKAKA